MNICPRQERAQQQNYDNIQQVDPERKEGTCAMANNCLEQQGWQHR